MMTKMTLPKAAVITALQKYLQEVIFKDGQCPIIKEFGGVVSSSYGADVPKFYELEVDPVDPVLPPPRLPHVVGPSK